MSLSTGQHHTSTKPRNTGATTSQHTRHRTSPARSNQQPIAIPTSCNRHLGAQELRAPHTWIGRGFTFCLLPVGFGRGSASNAAVAAAVLFGDCLAGLPGWGYAAGSEGGITEQRGRASAVTCSCEFCHPCCRPCSRPCPPARALPCPARARPFHPCSRPLPLATLRRQVGCSPPRARCCCCSRRHAADPPAALAALAATAAGS